MRHLLLSLEVWWIKKFGKSYTFEEFIKKLKDEL